MMTELGMKGVKAFGTRYTASIPALLKQLNISVILTSYQSEKTVLIRTDGKTLDVVYRSFSRPMGIAVDNEKLVLGSYNQLISFHRENQHLDKLKQPLQPIGEDITAPTLQKKSQKPLKPTGNRNSKFQAVDPRVDSCLVARHVQYTGMLNTHDLILDNGNLWGVSSSFSCVCTFHPQYSFVPYWYPPFITELEPEDRCHLNGLALKNGTPGFVTTFSTTNKSAAWRVQDSMSTGTVIDIKSNSLLVGDLLMPHSPRYHQGTLYFCHSGVGELCSVNPESGNTEVITRLPGFTRGLEIIGNLAFVGTSQVRSSNIKSPARTTELGNCITGVWIINITTAEKIGHVEFNNGVEQIYDIKVIPDSCFPELVEPGHPRLRNHFSLPTHPAIKRI